MKFLREKQSTLQSGESALLREESLDEDWNEPEEEEA